MTLFICAVVGAIIGYIGSKLKLRKSTVYILGFIAGLIIGIRSGHSEEIAIQNLRASSVRIAIGSGAIVQGGSGKPYILTNYHVCAGATWKGGLTAFAPEGTTITGRIVRKSPAVDLCAAYVNTNRHALKLGRKPAVGDDVYARGYPMGILSESHGNIGSEDTWDYFFPISFLGECPLNYKRVRDYDDRISGCAATFHSVQTSLYSRPGSSGSPVVDSNGDLVGVISSFDPKGDYEAGMVRYQDLKNFLEGL